jgi:hypothetical protein
VITVGNPLKLPRESECEILWAEPFRAKWAANSTAEIIRPNPRFIEVQSTSSPDDEAALQELAISLTTNRNVYAPMDFCIRLQGATLVGERAIIPNSSGKVITDSLHWNHTARIFEAEVRRRFEFVHLDFRDGRFTPTLGSDDIVYHDEELILLSAMEQGNYGAFLLRTISKLATLKYLGIQGPRFFVANDSEWQIKVLDAFGVSRNAIVGYDKTKIHQFKSLIVPDLPTSEFFPSDIVSDFYDKFIDEIVGTQSSFQGKAARIYVSRLRQARQRPHYRALQNEIELIEKLEQLGFYIFEPEMHPFEEQVRTFAAAEVVVGSSGAGMFNTIFCNQRARILSLESMPTWAALHANMYAGRKHEYAMMLGGSDATDQSEQKRWTADVEAVISRTKQLL